MKSTLSFLTLLVLALLSFHLTTANADGCVAGFCGKVGNKSSWELRYTTNPGCAYKKGTCDEKCNIWNWDEAGGPIVNCKQQYLAKGKNAGGGSVDVDAFTYADRSYCWNGKWKTKGVWTKFSTGTQVLCYDSDTSGGGHPCCGGTGGRPDNCCA